MSSFTTGDECVAETFDRFIASIDVPPPPTGEIGRRAAALRAGRRRVGGLWAAGGVCAAVLALSCAVSPPTAFAASVESAARAAFDALTSRRAEVHVYDVTRGTARAPRVVPGALAGRAVLQTQSSVVGDDGSTSWASTYRVTGTARTVVFIERPAANENAAQGTERSDVAAALSGARPGESRTFAYRRTVTVRGVAVTGLASAADTAVVDGILRALR
jgi:hypothetical protein